MYRGSNTNRGSRRGGRGGSRGGRGGNRGGYRNASHGNDSRNPTNVASRADISTFNGPRQSKAGLMGGCFLPKHIFGYFNPSVTDFGRNLVSSINSGEENPDGVSFAIVHVQNQPQWMSENIIYVKSNLHLLPQYAEKKSLLLETHKETSHDELVERIAAELTQSIKFDRYGVEDGPDMEIFDEEGEIASLVLPGDWMPVNYESPKFASVGTPSVKYAPVSDDPIAVFAGYKSDSNSSGFKFVAWFFIEEIELFAANSLDLARKMHDKKWTGDMGHEWAAIKLLRVEKGEPEWRPVPTIKRRPVTAQVSEEAKLTPEVVEKMMEYLAATDGKIVGPQDKAPSSACGENVVDEIQTGQPVDEVQDKSKPHESGGGAAMTGAVAEFGGDTNRCGDAVHGGVDNEAEVELEVKTEAVDVENHKEDAKENSVQDGSVQNDSVQDDNIKNPNDDDGGPDKEAIPETDNDTTKATDHHDEGVMSIQPKDKEVVVENGTKVVGVAKVEVNGNVAPMGVSEDASKSTLTMENMEGDGIIVEVLATAKKDEKLEEKEKEEEKEGEEEKAGEAEKSVEKEKQEKKDMAQG